MTFINTQIFATMKEMFITAINRVMQKACAIAAMLFGFGNAIRCAFFIDYGRFADKAFFTITMLLIGLVGMWMLNGKGEE